MHECTPHHTHTHKQRIHTAAAHIATVYTRACDACVCVKCQNAEPIMINGGLIAFSIGLLAIRMVCFVFRDWSLKISLVFHWFLIPQTTIGKHVLFELVRIFCFDYSVRSANKISSPFALFVILRRKNLEIFLPCHIVLCDDVKK